MSNLFQEVLTNTKSGDETLTGSTYPYYTNIKIPQQIGMRDTVTIKQTDNDIDGLIQYVNLLVTGKSNVSARGGRLGNNGNQDNIPFISGGMGNLNVLNPFSIISELLSGPTPQCQEITMQTIDINNNNSSETHYVTLADIQNRDPCSFNDRINPVTKAKCIETFQTGVTADASPIMSDDIIDQVYFASLAGLGIYILHGIMKKSQ